jgi:deoxyadenosine/deoxycytidine kinase
MTSDMPALICVTGPIGAAKTTLVGQLAARLGATAYRERNDTNLAYGDALKDPQRWAFESELTFLIGCLENWSTAREARRIAVLERCAADNVAVFGASRLARGEISDSEYQILCRCAELAPVLGGTPDLIVLLTCPASVLVERVRNRKEKGESAYTEAYLQDIASRYEDWGRGWRASPVIFLDSGKNDVRKPSVVNMLAAEICRHLKQRTVGTDQPIQN